MRLRVPKPTPGTSGTIRETARWLGVDHSVIRYQVNKGAILLLSDGRVDWVSAWHWAKTYKPNKDNTLRKPRTIPETQASTNGHRKTMAEIQAEASELKRKTAPPTKRDISSPLVVPGNGVTLHGREWLDEFYAYKARRAGGEINPKTMENYKECLERFIRAFPVLPITGNRIRDRQGILDYIHGLQNLTVGGELGGGSKGHHLQVIVTFVRWLGREHGAIIPDLADAGIAETLTQNVPIWPDEIRLVLNEAAKQQKKGNHTEYLIALLFAQTACRVGELCTLRKEFLHDHWAEIWGKGTTANKTGYRELPIPDESYKLLKQHLDQFKVLTWIGSDHRKPKALVGPIEPAIKGVPIDMRRHETYRVRRPSKETIYKVQYLINRLMNAASVNQKGKGCHSFRRAFQAQFVKNGGSREFYRLIMGHRQKSNMDDLYTHAPIEEIVEQARRYAPRSFLLEEATQTQLALEAQKLAALDPTLPHHEDDDDE